MSTTYLVCKAHALDSALLPESTILDLASSKTLNDFLDKLAQTSYGSELTGVKDVWDAERSLGIFFVKRLTSLVNSAYEAARDFLRAYLKRYEVQNLVWIARMKSRGSSKEEIERELLPIWWIEEFDPSPLIEAETLDELVSLMRKFGYSEVKEGEKDLLAIEAALKASYYRYVFNFLENRGVPDKNDILELLALEIDLHNLRTCIISLVRGYSREFVEKFLVKNPKGMSKGFLLKLVSGGDPAAFIEHFPRYERLLRFAIAGEDWRLEIESLKALKRSVNFKKIPKYISFFYVLKYILDLEIEYRNLRSILLAIYHGIPAERRRELLILSKP